MEKPDDCENIARDKDEFKDKCEIEEEKYHRQERYYGKFETSVSLPDDIVDDLSQINAKYIDGVLNIVVPRKQIDQPKDKKFKIKIA